MKHLKTKIIVSILKGKSAHFFKKNSNPGPIKFSLKKTKLIATCLPSKSSKQKLIWSFYTDAIIKGFMYLTLI